MEKQKYLDFVELHNSDIANYKNYAFNLHDKTVNQKYGENNSLPYSYHLKSVFYYTLQYLHYIIDNEEDILPVLFAALFHDSIEDARLTYSDVKKIAKNCRLDDRQIDIAAEIVYALTNEKGRNRHERANDKYYQGIRETPYAGLVKMADRMANTVYSNAIQSSMLEMYKEEMPHFLESIIGKSLICSVPDEMIKEINDIIK